MNTILYALRNGCAWRALPHDFPPWNTVYYHFRQWRKDGLWEQINDTLPSRAPEGWSAGLTDRRCRGQPIGSDHGKRGDRGYDGAKRLNGRKRHILVDTLGLLLQAVVHPANLQDRIGAKLLFAGVKERFPLLSLIWADQGYTGKPLSDWVKEHLQAELEVVNRPRKWGRYPEGVESPEMPAFTVLKRRWVVERTFAWEGRNRRLAKDYEGLPETEEAYLYLGMARLMLKRLARA